MNLTSLQAQPQPGSETWSPSQEPSQRAATAAGIASASLRQRLTNGAVWSLVGAASNRALYLGVSILAARILGKTAYGQFSFIQSTVGMLALLAGFGFGSAAAKHIAQFRTANPARAGRLIGFCSCWGAAAGAATSLICLCAAPLLTRGALFDPTLVAAFRISAVLVFCGAVNGIQTGILNGLEAFRSAAFLNVANGALLVTGVLIGAQAAGLIGCTWGAGISGLIGCALAAIIIQVEARHRKLKPTIKGWRPEFKSMLGFAFPTVLATLLVVPVYWLGQAVLARNWSYSAQAEYSIGAQWRTAVSWLPVVLTTAFLPILASLRQEEEAHRQRIVRFGLLASAGLALVAALSVAGANKLILSCYGKAFLSAGPVVVVLALAAVFDAVNELISQSLLAQGRAWLRLWANGLWAVLTTCGILVVVPRCSAIGLAAVLCATQGIHLLIQLLIYSKFASNGNRCGI